jgi:hypothetical protein
LKEILETFLGVGEEVQVLCKFVLFFKNGAHAF